MDEIHVTYVGDKHADNHDYDENTDDGHDNNNNLYGKMSMFYRGFIDEISMIYRWQ